MDLKCGKACSRINYQQVRSRSLLADSELPPTKNVPLFPDEQKTVMYWKCKMLFPG